MTWFTTTLSSCTICFQQVESTMNGYNPPYFIPVYGIIYRYNTHGQKGHITINGLYGLGTSGIWCAHLNHSHSHLCEQSSTERHWRSSLIYSVYARRSEPWWLRIWGKTQSEFLTNNRDVREQLIFESSESKVHGESHKSDKGFKLEYQHGSSVPSAQRWSICTRLPQRATE